MLGKWHYELEDAPASEYDKWVAFLRLREEERKKQENRQKAKSRSSKRG